MQRSLWASLRSVGRCSPIPSLLNTTRADFPVNCQHFLKMHKGGARNKSEFSGGGGRRGGRGRHPSGLSGKQIGLWYAAKGKRSKINRELKQRAYVTMDSHHEERISELLDKIRADESGADDGSGAAGPSHQIDIVSPGYSIEDVGLSTNQDKCDSTDKWLFEKDGMNSGYARSEAGRPSTSKDWCDVSQEWTYKKDKMDVDEDLSTVSTTTFGNMFTSEADQAIYHTPDDFSGGLSQAGCRDKSMQRDHVLDQCLREEQQRKLTSGGARYKAMQEFRRKLPAYDKREGGDLL